MSWPGPVLTDSGGFQIFSLAHLRKIDDDGATFRSHIDGSEHRFTPESCVELQERIGAATNRATGNTRNPPSRERTAGRKDVLPRRRGMTSSSTESFRAGCSKT